MPKTRASLINKFKQLIANNLKSIIYN